MIGDLAGASESEVLELGYLYCRPIGRGMWVGVNCTLSGAGLYVIEDRVGWKQMWFYSYEWNAVQAAEELPSDWDGQSSDPGGPWIKHKPSQRLGPGWSDSAVRVIFALAIGQHEDETSVGMFANAHEATDHAQRVCGVLFTPADLVRLDRERNVAVTAWHSGPKAERWARVERRDLR